MKSIIIQFDKNGDVKTIFDNDISMGEILFAVRMLQLKVDWKISDQLMENKNIK